MNHYRNSPFLDRLYKNASAEYISTGGPPDRRIRSIWISNQMSNELDWYDKKVASIHQKDIESNPRINEIRSLLSY